LITPNVFDNFDSIIPIKWRLASQQHVEDYSCAPHITLGIAVVGNYFRGDVIRSAYWWTFDILSKPYLFTSSKINQSYTVILFTVQEYIFKLDVAVAYLLLMQVGKSLQKLSHYLYSFGLPQFIPPHHLIVK